MATETAMIFENIESMASFGGNNSKNRFEDGNELQEMFRQFRLDLFDRLSTYIKRPAQFPFFDVDACHLAIDIQFVTPLLLRHFVEIVTQTASMVFGDIE